MMLTWHSQNSVASPLFLFLVDCIPNPQGFLLFITAHIQAAETGSGLERWACWEKDRRHHSAVVVKQSTMQSTVDMLGLSTGGE